MVSSISYRVENMSEVQIEECIVVEALAATIMNFASDGIKGNGSLVAALELNENRSNSKKFVLDMRHRDYASAIPSIEEAQKLELNSLPPHIRYVFLGRDDSSSVFIAADFNAKQVECLVDVQMNHWFD